MERVTFPVGALAPLDEATVIVTTSFVLALGVAVAAVTVVEVPISVLAAGHPVAARIFSPTDRAPPIGSR